MSFNLDQEAYNERKKSLKTKADLMKYTGDEINSLLEAEAIYGWGSYGRFGQKIWKHIKNEENLLCEAIRPVSNRHVNPIHNKEFFMYDNIARLIIKNPATAPADIYNELAKMLTSNEDLAYVKTRNSDSTMLEYLMMNPNFKFDAEQKAFILERAEGTSGPYSLRYYVLKHPEFAANRAEVIAKLYPSDEDWAESITHIRHDLEADLNIDDISYSKETKTILHRIKDPKRREYYKREITFVNDCLKIREPKFENEEKRCAHCDHILNH